MKQPASLIERRLPTLVVGLATLLLIPGCRMMDSTSFQEASNPRVCPVCVASTFDQCHCFPAHSGAGYSTTRWSKLELFDPQGGMILLHGDEPPTPQAWQASAARSLGASESGAFNDRLKSDEMVEIVESLELAELVELVELADHLESADQLPELREPEEEIEGELPIAPVMVAEVPVGVRD